LKCFRVILKETFNILKRRDFSGDVREEKISVLGLKATL
jgi:hypothetical protein